MVTGKYLLDTSVIIEALRLKTLDADNFLATSYQGGLYISPITIAELFSGKSAEEPETDSYLRYLIGLFETVPLGVDVAITAGKIRLEYKTGMPDALIAASAMENSLVLVTHNFKDFTRIKGLKLSAPKKFIGEAEEAH